ncbi:MAG: FKBP-type peptidyl-prolyl cis-trans isomerase [Alphaproteobacteria bacterium]|nr:FKBP-type peptidyl-prolyl cis-trans isomerase [Alphaproteobacteria bacterium]
MKTESGLAYKVLVKGDGTEVPEDASTVEVHYTGWHTTGEKFDSSRDRGQPARFGVRGVIAGWTEGLKLMHTGDHYRFWIPEELAYQGRPGKPAGMLVFDVELIDIKTPPKPPEAPPDVAAAPADATTTASGLQYKIVNKGSGGKKPTAESMVAVHYAGWQTTGENFDFSRKRGKPAAFGVTGVIPGWTEGLQLMETGDTFRFWIPPALAYEGKRGPQGTLVFDVELLDVVDAPPWSAPADAKSEESGLKWKLLSGPASAEQKPTAEDLVKVNWIGWVAKDKLGFDSNLGDEPQNPMRQLRSIAGFQEAVTHLNVGEKGRFWIPESLAFAGRPGAPPGDLVYDIELVSMEAGKAPKLPPSHPQ